MCEKSYAKVNIFLKITGLRENYHELTSRFVRVKNLFDTIEFIPSKEKEFKITGNFSCPLEKNTIFKAYTLLKNYKNVEDFFKNHYVKIEKNIPEFAGLGGGSSNSALFLNMVNKICNLSLSKQELARIGEKIGADVPFFIYEYDSANVSGIGEIVEEFKEEPLNIEVFTPNIKCNTGKIFQTFRQNFYKKRSKEEALALFSKSSYDILKSLDIYEANDLLNPALSLNPDLKQYIKEGWFFSGSGSSFFKVY